MALIWGVAAILSLAGLFLAPMITYFQVARGLYYVIFDLFALALGLFLLYGKSGVVGNDVVQKLRRETFIDEAR